MTDMEWKEEYFDIYSRLDALDPVALPKSLSSACLFEKLDRMEAAPEAGRAPLPKPVRVLRWRPVMSYAAAFLLLVAVYYGTGMSGTGMDTTHMAVSDAAAVAAAPRESAGDGGDNPGAQNDSGSSAEAVAEMEKGFGPANSPQASVPSAAVSEEAPRVQLSSGEAEPGEEYRLASQNVVLVVPAMGGEAAAQTPDSAQEAFERAELVVCGTLSDVSVSHYGPESGAGDLPWGDAVLENITCLKGDWEEESLSFVYGGGLVPATEYYEHAAKASANVESVKEGLEGKYVRVVLGGSQPELKLDGRYVVMLNRDDEGGWLCIPMRWSLLEVLEGQITGPEGETYGTPETPDWQGGSAG